MAEPLERTIRELEERRFQAQIEADVATLQELLADTLVYTHSSATSDSKASFIAGIKAGKWQYKRVERPVEAVQAYGDCAVVTGEVHIDVFVAVSLKLVRSRYIVVWVKRDARWQMVAWQSTPLPSAAA